MQFFAKTEEIILKYLLLLGNEFCLLPAFYFCLLVFFFH